MLDPYDRRHLLEILRPPDGYTLDFAIGTTFSLDLLALMTAPLGFTLFEAESDSGSPDSLALIESIRRYAGRISIFCQEGRIHIPKEYGQPLFTFLEGSVFQVHPPYEGSVFHPKAWVLRYNSEEGPVVYRFLCLSRNLTYDRSWDAALVLDGVLEDRIRAFASNHPLGDFLASLPGMVEKGVPMELQKRIDLMQHEVRRVSFNPPQGFDEMIFYPLGIGNRRSNPFSDRIDRILVISPFLSESRLDSFASLGKGATLISRLDSLEKIKADSLRQFSDIYYLKEEFVVQEDSSEFIDPGQGQIDIEKENFAVLDENPQGLHAKLYVADAGGQGRIWTGSANATDAAFQGNIEFLVELRGRKKFCGIDAILNGGKEAEDETEAGLRTLLDPFTINGGPTVDEMESLKHLADKVRNALIQSNLAAHVSMDGDDHFSISMEGRSPVLPEEATVKCRPITLQKSRAICFSSIPGALAEFRHLQDNEISAFFAFESTIILEEKRLADGFVLKLPLTGAPEDRTERVLRALLKDKSQVLRLMLLLLSLDGRSDPEGLIVRPGRTNGGNWASQGMIPLFECMIRALARDQRRLDDLNHLIQDLRSHPDTKDLLPDRIDEIWEPIWEARKMIGGDEHDKT